MTLGHEPLENPVRQETVRFSCPHETFMQNAVTASLRRTECFMFLTFLLLLGKPASGLKQWGDLGFHRLERLLGSHFGEVLNCRF